MRKKSNSRRKGGIHLLNDRLLALRNLVRARNEEITMEDSRDFDLTEEDITDTAALSSDDALEDASLGSSKEFTEIAPYVDVEDLPLVTQGAPIADAPGESKQNPPILDLDDLPVLTDSVSLAVSPSAEVEKDSQELHTDGTMAPATMEELVAAANGILELIGRQISYANLPHSSSSDYEALSRAIARYLQKKPGSRDDET